MKLVYIVKRDDGHLFAFPNRYDAMAFCNTPQGARSEMQAPGGYPVMTFRETMDWVLAGILPDEDEE